MGRCDIAFKRLAKLFVPTTAMANESVQQVSELIATRCPRRTDAWPLRPLPASTVSPPDDAASSPLSMTKVGPACAGLFPSIGCLTSRFRRLHSLERRYRRRDIYPTMITARLTSAAHSPPWRR